MKIVIAPDSFKGTNTSLAVASHIEEGILRVYPDAQCIKVPVADGGEGTVDSVIDALGGKKETVKVCGPLGKKRNATYGLAGETAVIEMAEASGLPLIPDDKRNPMLATSRGTGDLILDALDKGCRKIIMGIGGSATNDGGTGLARALGYRFLDADGTELLEGGGSLDNLASIDVSAVDKRLKDVEIMVACDVTNPLLGEEGASFVYGPQKGADPSMVRHLDKALERLADIAENCLGIEARNIPGSGAAGGLGFGLIAFCGADLKSGIDIVLDTVKLDSYFGDADLVITGEGRMDSQSVNGKVPVGVAGRAKKHGLPVLAIVGDMGPGAMDVLPYGVDSIMSTVNRAMPLNEALDKSSPLMVEAAERAMRMIAMGMSLNK